MHPAVIFCGRSRRGLVLPAASWFAAERSIEQPAMIERPAIHVEQCADPKIAGAIPHHVGEARIGHRIDDLTSVNVGAHHTKWRYDGKIVAAGTDHELRWARTAEIHRLKEMDVARDGHPHTGRHYTPERQFLHRVFDLIRPSIQRAAHGVERPMGHKPSL